MAILGMEFQAKLKDTKVASELAFPRDGTSLGQTRMGRPIVPLSRNKEMFLSRCPFVLGQGQEEKSRDKITFLFSTLKFFQKKKFDFFMYMYLSPGTMDTYGISGPN